MERVRIDKWLWAARFAKTRSEATEAVAAGHVKVNGVRVKPAKDVVVGDTVTIRRNEQQWEVTVTGLADRRGSAEVAATLYAETPESTAAREDGRSEHRLAGPSGAERTGRPTKRDRRRTDSLRGRR